MNIIYTWAKMLSESSEEPSQIEEVEGGQIGISRPDELGKNINGIISQDIFENRDGDAKDLFEADFKCNISDTESLMRRFPEIQKGTLPYGTSFIYFMCSHGKLDPKRMVSYVNEICSDVLPFAIKLDDVKYLGSYDVKQGSENKQDLFVIATGSFGDSTKLARKRKEVADAFEKIRDGYSDEALMVKYGDKEYLRKYLKQNINALNKLDDGQNYLLLIALKDTLKPSKRIKVASAIDSATDVLGGKELVDDDIQNIGKIRGKYKATGSVFELDVFAIKAA